MWLLSCKYVVAFIFHFLLLQVSVLSYSAKFASCYYGPFRWVMAQESCGEGGVNSCAEVSELKLLLCLCTEMLRNPSLRLGTDAATSCLPERGDSPFELWYVDVCVWAENVGDTVVGDAAVVLCCRSAMWERELICWWWSQGCRIWISWEKSRTRSVTKSAQWGAVLQLCILGNPVVMKHRWGKSQEHALQNISDFLKKKKVTVAVEESELSSPHMSPFSSPLTPWRCTTCQGSLPWCGTEHRLERLTCGLLWWRPWPPSAGQVRGTESREENTQIIWTEKSPL